MTIFPVFNSFGLGPAGPWITGILFSSCSSFASSGCTRGSGVHSSTSSSISYPVVNFCPQVQCCLLTFSLRGTKFFPDPSARVRDCNNVLTAKIMRSTSSNVLPGSFWWDDLIYRVTTPDPGTWLHVDSSMEYVDCKKANTGSRFGFMLEVAIVSQSEVTTLLNSCTLVRRWLSISLLASSTRQFNVFCIE